MLRSLTVFLAAVVVAGVFAEPIPVVRVGLASLGRPGVFEVTADSAFSAFGAAANQPLGEWKAGQTARVQAIGDAVQVGTRQFAAVYFSSEAGLTTLASQSARRTYRGWLYLFAKAGKLTAVNEVPLEAYLLGVVPVEMPPSWHPEALKAQAVAARTYTIARIGSFAKEGFDLDDTTRSHQYRGAGAEDPRTTEAVRSTANQVLVFSGKPISAVYSTVSGGVTAGAAEAFFGGSAPYLASMVDVDEKGKPYAAWATSFAWTLELSKRQLEGALTKAGHKLGNVLRLEIAARSESGRAALVSVAGTEASVAMTGADFRSLVGADVLRSTLFSVKASSEGWRIEGKGWGHGAGMCQAGAQGRALAGQTYSQILKAYYKGVTLLTTRGSALALTTRGSLVERRTSKPGR